MISDRLTFWFAEQATECVALVEPSALHKLNWAALRWLNRRPELNARSTASVALTAGDVLGQTNTRLTTMTNQVELSASVKGRK
jgi:hypothetical protein